LAFAHWATVETQAPCVENWLKERFPVLVPVRLEEVKVNVSDFPASVVPVKVLVEAQEYVPVAKVLPFTVSVQLPPE
jgi:hypothetical protein